MKRFLLFALLFISSSILPKTYSQLGEDIANIIIEMSVSKLTKDKNKFDQTRKQLDAFLSQPEIEQLCILVLVSLMDPVTTKRRLFEEEETFWKSAKTILYKQDGKLNDSIIRSYEISSAEIVQLDRYVHEMEQMIQNFFLDFEK